MNEKQPSPHEYDYTPEELQIPPDLKIDSIDQLIKKEGREENNNRSKLYFGPYLVAERIRALKKEYYDSQVHPGAERKQEIIEEYERIKSQRKNIKEQILEQIELTNDDIQEILNRADEARTKAQRKFEVTHKYENEPLAKNAEQEWQIADDFIRLFQEDMENLTLEDEDEGLKNLSS